MSSENRQNETAVGRVVPGGQALEASMAGKQLGKKHKKAKKQQEANLGQKEARQEGEKEAELSQMGELSRDNDKQGGQQR